ncbi:MAG: acyl-CoA dehydrogenase [Fuerstiella sp.]
MPSPPRSSATNGPSLTEVVEAQLGDPRNPDSVLSFAYSQQIDESEQFPELAVRWLYDRQLCRHFVPQELGGAFHSFEELAELIRVLSRRDLTTSIAFSTLFWSFLTWMDGTEEQKKWLADYILRQHGAMCLAYSEKDHGADLLAGATIAEPTPGGFMVTGEKWPINRATISGLCFLLATTDRSAGPRGLSLFMVDKGKLDPRRYHNLPKILTHGLRGSDVSGIAFDKCSIPADSLLGGTGLGLETALKGFQVTRTLCAAFSLGAGDTALRTTLEFAQQRTLYNELVVELPHASSVLSDAFLDLLICDCVTISGLRAFHAVPGQISVWSAVVKYFVPTTIEAMIQNLSVVMGARYYMRNEHEWGTFQRVLRDAAIISVFDGSTVVNLHALLLQFRNLARRSSTDSVQEATLRQIYHLQHPLAPFKSQNLSLASRHGNAAMNGLPLTLKYLRSLNGIDNVEQSELDEILAIGERLAHEISAFHAALSETKFEHGHRQSPAAFRTARTYCGLHAAACCLHMWAWNHADSSNFISGGKWLLPALKRLFEVYLGITDIEFPGTATEVIAEELRNCHNENRMFSLRACRLG